MTADNNSLEQVMDLLRPLGGISSKAMFGEFGMFHEGLCSEYLKALVSF